MAGHESDSSNVFDRYHFLIRRLHSLTGLVPVGVFLMLHLTTNASILGGGAQFQAQVSKIHSLPMLKVIEVCFILLPLLFHAVLGVVIWLGGRPNAHHYPYGANVRYTLQRVTGVIAFVFIMYHLWHMHWVGAPLGGANFKFEPGQNVTSATTTAMAIQASWWIAPFYALGILASVYHLANGIWTSLITWGVTIRPKTQRASGYVCAVFGVILGAVGLGALSGFRTFDPNKETAPSTPAHAAAEDASSGHSG